MLNFLEHITISNFKSIRSCRIADCKRINIFIGRPNTGKSNILEALSLFSLPFIKESASKKILQFIRLENEAELFYNGDFEKPIEVSTNNNFCSVKLDKIEGLQIGITEKNGKDFTYTVDGKLNLKTQRKGDYAPYVRRYSFSANTAFRKGYSRYLIPPFGSNLLNVIQANTTLKDEFAGLFKEYGLQIIFDKASQSLKIIQIGKNGIFLIPYNSIADTLQRIIFYKTAIASNRDAVLLFEDPEARLSPPYIGYITEEMIHKKDSQYFITTHSPFILNDLLENGREELAVFVVNYDKHQTEIRRLSEDELQEVFQNGVDLFTNNESYL